MADIFVSYARKDADQVATIVAALEEAGFTVWWDRHMRPGTPDYTSAIERELEAAKAVIVFWSKHSRTSKYVKAEAVSAEDDGKLIPARLDDAKLPVPFNINHTISLEGWSGDRADPRLVDLEGALREKIGQPNVTSPLSDEPGSTTLKPSQGLPSIIPTGLAVAGIGAPFAFPSTMGLFGLVTLTAGSFMLLFRLADADLPAYWKDLAMRWFLPVKGGVRVSVAESFNTLFEAVFGPKHLSFKCIWRSAVASMLTLSLLAALAYAMDGGFSGGLDGTGQLIQNAILMTIATNILGDYVSLGQTRLFLRAAARTPAILPFLALLDLVLTGIIFAAVLFSAFYVLSATGLFAGVIADWEDPTTFFLSLVPRKPFDPTTWSVEGWIFMISLATTYVTSVWLWLVWVLEPVARFLLGRDGDVSFFGRALGAQANPFTAIGVIAGVMIVGFGSGVVKFAVPALATDTRFRVWHDCDHCPELVEVPAGEFLMGSPQNESYRESDEDDVAGEGGQQINVTISKSFAVGRHEVTWAQWQACIEGGGCRKAGSTLDWGKGNRPVISVSWHDAQAYVIWLSEMTGKGYRLLSEAEWEYVARAGTTSAFSFGEKITKEDAIHEASRTLPVGSYAPNPFGLYDVHGNAWEWVQDCYEPSYANHPGTEVAVEPADPSACTYRILRGGSWFNKPQLLRSAFRNGLTPKHRNGSLGFRVARSLN